MARLTPNPLTTDPWTYPVRIKGANPITHFVVEIAAEAVERDVTPIELGTLCDGRPPVLSNFTYITHYVQKDGFKFTSPAYVAAYTTEGLVAGEDNWFYIWEDENNAKEDWSFQSSPSDISQLDFSSTQLDAGVAPLEDGCGTITNGTRLGGSVNWPLEYDGGSELTTFYYYPLKPTGAPLEITGSWARNQGAAFLDGEICCGGTGSPKIFLASVNDYVSQTKSYDYEAGMEAVTAVDPNGRFIQGKLIGLGASHRNSRFFGANSLRWLYEVVKPG